MRSLFLSVAFSIVLVGSTTADVVNYGNFVGTSVSFNGVIESSASIGNGPGQVDALFGAPNVMGNMLVFNPTEFEANISGTGSDLTNGQLMFSLVAAPGYFITGIQIEEFGDYTLATPFIGGQAFASSSGSGFLSTADGNFFGGFAFSDLSNTPVGVFGAPWNGGFFIGIDPSSTANFAMDNRLFAAAFDTTDGAIIRKLGFKVTVFTSAIPEPSSLGLGLLALAGVLTVRKRR